MATKNFYVKDGLKVKGNTLLNGATYSDTPLSKLHVKSAANGASANLNNVNGLIIENSGSSDSNYALKLATGSGNIFNVTNSGKVGVGITNPSETLTVVGDISASGSIYGNIEDVELDLTLSEGNLFVGNSSNVAASDSTIFVDTANSRVGIGTTSPTNLLTVNGGSESIGVYFSTNPNPRLTIGADGTWNYFKGKSGQGHYFNTTGGAIFVIQNGGNVGIGTASPGKTLHVYTSDDIISKFSSSDAGGRILINDTTTSAYINAASGVASIGQANGLSTSNVNILSSGFVGIGTTSPDVQLHVKSASSTFAQVRVEAAADGHDSSVAYSQAGSIKGITGYDDSTNTVAIKYGTFGGSGIDIDSSGNVGVGTTNPNEKLTVTGNISASGTVYADAFSSVTGGDTIDFNDNLHLDGNLTVNGTISGNDVFTIGGGGTSSGGMKSLPGGGTDIYALKLARSSTARSGPDIWDASSDSIIIGTTSSDTTFAVTSGFVGIGTTNPTHNLSVDGTVGGILYSSSYIEFPASGGDAGNTIIKANDDVKIGFCQDFVVKQSGNVGIGTTNPSNYDGNADDLVIQTSGHTGMTIRSSSTAEGNIFFADGTTGNERYRGIIRYNHDSDQLNLFTAATNQVNILSSGNVGIGTTNPSSKLHIVNSANSAFLVNTGAGTGYTYLRSTNTGGEFLLGINRSDGVLFSSGLAYATSLGTTGSTALQFHTNNNPRVTVDTSGNVGIGTTSPTSLLHIDTGANSAANFRLGANRTVANAAVGQLIGDWNGTVVAKIALKTGDDTTNKDDGEIAFEVAAAGTTAEAMRIQNNGNVGIGITDPDEKLEVDGNIKIGAGKFYRMAGDAFQIGIDGSAVGMRFYADSTERMTILSGGNVGIGTATPGSALDVNGTLKVQNNNSSSNYMEFTAPGSWNVVGSRPVIKVGGTEKMRASANGVNIGGSTDATHTLDVDGAAHFSSDVTIEGTVLHCGDLTVNGDLTVQGTTTTLNTEVCTTSAMEITNAGTGPALVVNQTGSQPVIDFQDDGTSTFYIEDGGNVGIGTTDPGANLHIYGSGQQSMFIGSSDGARALLELDGAGNGDGAGGDYAYLAHNADGAFDIKNLQNNSIRLATGSSGTTRMTITSAGDVGIGDSSPVVGLSLYGDGNKSRIKLANTGGHQVNIGLWDNSNYRIEGDANRPILITSYDTDGGVRIGASGSADMTVVGGNVGIGTTNPDRKLHVFISDTGVTPDANSNLVIEDNDSNNFINVLTNNTSQGGIFFGDSDDSNIAGMLYNHSDDTLRFRTNNTNTRLSITSGGNVGIGTDSPTRKLHIDGGSASATSIYIDANSINGTDIEQSASDFRLQVRDNIPLLFFTNNSEKVRVAADGNVGIGTTNPSTILDINGTITLSGDVEHQLAKRTQSCITAATADTTELRGRNVDLYAFDDINLRAGTGDSINLFAQGGSAKFQINDEVVVNGAGCAINFRVQGDTDTNLIRANGALDKVGIGVASPNEKLTVSGNISASGVIYGDTFCSNSGSCNTIDFNDNLDVDGEIKGTHFYTGYDWTTKTGGFHVGNDGLHTGSVSFYDGSLASSANIFREAVTSTFYVGARGGTETNGIAILSGGNVGIGITNPAYKLDVAGSLHAKDGSSAFAFNEYNNGATIWLDGADGDFTGGDYFNISANNSAQLTFGFAGGTNMTMTSAGNLGIGVANPDFPLEVAGAIGIDDYIYHNGDHNTYLQFNSDAILLRTGGQDRLKISNTETVINDDTLGHDFRVEGDTDTALFFTDASTDRVGIGTTNPIGKLHVKHTCTSTAISGVNPALVFNIQNSGISADSYYGNVRWGRANSNGGTPSLGIIARTDSSNPANISHLAFYTEEGTSCTLTERMVIENGGNVGIGTTSPSNKLQVVGGATSVNLAVTGAGEFTSNDFGTTFKTTNTSQKRSQIFFKDSADVITARVGNDIEGCNNAKLQFIAGSGSTPHMSILSGGNVGIGTTTPSRDLHVNSGGSNIGILTESTDAGAFIAFKDNTTTSDSTVYAGARGNNFEIWGDAVGIGTTDFGTNNTGKLFVGGYCSNGSSAIAQFNGFIRADRVITHTAAGAAIAPNTDTCGTIGTASARFANVFAVCTTTGAVIESNLCSEGIDSCPQGSVVVWRDGKLQGTTQEYDYSVMGVTTPGTDSPIVMGAEPILVTGDIKEGDPIVTSSKLNHGMKGDRSCDLHGKVIAQALEDGSGESYIIQGMIRKF